MATLLVQSGQTTHPACDLCYARKIKCDRSDPCGNCIDSKAKCLRTRPKRVGRPRQSTGAGGDGKTESMINRLSRLESSVTRLATILSNGKTPAEDDDSASPTEQQDSATIKGTPASRSLAGPSPASEARPADREARDRPAKRVRLESPESPLLEDGPKIEANGERETNGGCAVAGTPDHDFARATEIEAQNFIQGELADSSRNISDERRSVLESALEFIGQMEHPTSRPSFLPATNKCVTDIADCLIAPAPEFFHMILSGNQKSIYNLFSVSSLNPEPDPESQRQYPGAYDMEFSTYISRDTLERMNLAMHNKSEDEQTLIQYSVCVNAYASTFLWNLPEAGEGEDMQQALEKSRDDYLRRCLTALNYISILQLPSLSLLQALLTGTTLLQKLGDTPKCWMLASNACRICVALGLHHSEPLGPPNNELSSEQRELRACFLWCYVFDKGLAMSLGRPVCMPIWDVPDDIIAPIDPARPFTSFVHILFKFSKIQATIVCDLHYQPAQTNSPQRKEATITSLKRQMDKIQKQVVEIRAFPPHSSDVFLISEWTSLEFVYHSIMTVILRFDTSVVLDPIKREECLDHARRAFVALQNLKTHISKTMDEKSFASFLPWTVLYYPLRPYFVLFCNVVATSHVGDFELMKEFADTLMELPSLNSSAQRLQKLCATLVGLCAPLIQRAKEQHSNRTSNSDGSKNAAPTNGMTSNIQNQQIFNNGVVGDGGIPMVGPGPSTSIGPWFQQNMIGGAGAISGVSQDANGARTSSSEEMFNVLFDVQPSLDWLGSDVFGQGTNWSDFDGNYNMN